LYFDGKREAAKKRLQRLKVAGLVAERPRRPYEPAILFLGRAGFDLLKERGAFAAYEHLRGMDFQKRSQIKDLTLRHELAVMDVKSALVSATRLTRSFTLVEFCTWPALCEFRSFQPNGELVT